MSQQEFCVYCNGPIFSQFQHPCTHFVVDLDDEWGTARRSDEWKEAERVLRRIVCKEYGHAFFAGPPYTWKTYCRRCGLPRQGEGNG